MGIVSFGGLASGIDTNSLIAQLVSLERRRSVGLLESQQVEAQAQQSALQTFDGKLAAVLSAADKLRDATTVLARKASSSDTSVATVAAGSGAVRGTTQVTVNALAQGSIATSSTAKTSASDTIATASGSFSFQLGSGTVQTVSIDSTTTLQGLSDAINALGAGVSASVVNLGTTASPDYRLRLASIDTGTSNQISIVTDDTDLSVAVTQSASDASLTVSGFATAITRESNVVSDVIPGVTLSLLKTGGPITVTVETDADAVAADVQTFVDAYNDLVGFVDSQSTVTQDTASRDRSFQAGPLAFDSTPQSILDALQTNVTGAVSGLSGSFSLLAEVGVTTNRDGTLAFDSTELSDALASDEQDVASLFSGSGGVDGVFDRVHDYVSGVTGSGGVLPTHTQTVSDRIDSLQSRIDEAQRNLDAFEADLRATFTSLEVLLSGLQSQGAFLANALGGGGRTS